MMVPKLAKLNQSRMPKVRYFWPTFPGAMLQVSLALEPKGE
ncbi:hypothetical protein UF75_4083 [Desulfosporosinus sp. I2]|nr:hypothetical protein UF75_4083 [Desulfosporosinus sp. I2]